ncbi:MAG: NAD(P)H-dependent glycerol-3-phosphate dehydrogenase [Clostridia bacterium]|nr:NAD(P)H-dependent glycerol-3-phosphate dehydrogenase [Clostridia bacterium]
MKITVVGCGRWGSLITWYLNRQGHSMTLYGQDFSPQMQRFMAERRNDLLELDERVELSTSYDSIRSAEVVVVSIPAQAFRGFLEEIKPLGIKNKTFVLCMKGIEIGTGKRLSEVASENLDPSNKVAVWLGPGHVQEFYAGIPNCMVIDSEDTELKEHLVNEFSSELIRFYYGTDIIGNEIGAAAKNVVGIAAGILDGLGLSSLKGALMSRGTHEIARLIVAMGGNELSAYGLCHLGDYEATVFSKYSHNRTFGEKLVKGEKYDSLAEGYYTVKAMMELSEKYKVELPICEAVYKILYCSCDARQTLDGLFRRSLKYEQ